MGEPSVSEDNYGLYRSAKIGEGQRFQDFIMERSARLGMILNTYCSKEGQRLGENMMGMEIKRDGLYRTSGNLYIEVAEKARPREGDYVPAGIMRSDNSWLYGIGDELCFWIFSISLLRHFYDNRDKMGFREPPPKPTSKGYLLPVEKANKFCARRVAFEFDGTIKQVWNGSENCKLDLKADALPEAFQSRLTL